MRTLSQLSIHFCLLCGLILLANVAHAENRKMVIHFEEYPPYEYTEDGEVKGINMDLMKEAFKRMDIKLSFKPMPWKRGVYELQNGGIVCLASGFKTPEREVYTFFPSEPLAMENVVVVTSAVSGVEITSLEDLRGLTIGVVREYAYGHDFDSMLGLNKIEATSNNQLLKMLLSQRMDVAIMNKAVARFLAKKIGKLAHIKFIYDVNSEPLYLLFSRARGFEAADMARRFSKELKGMREDGTFATIQMRY